ncbi:hypothetical protein [Aurantimonas endophytica]|uniref:Uncharacterized protein n=1 Tax=Aurantimonas endophytica TaxID=1522175 RepID=A0A7W6MPR5_9HYPH|nr:hypothetical protein [Aurantimonas endophytica]MBB4003184.1 hypothetical protein [Aurantimonas endophytica]MCO6404051.1 hypothetical protein [Aurantimonas endophytica]
MIRRLLSRLFRPSAQIRQEVTVLLAMYGTKGAWLEARDRMRAAQKDARWVDDGVVRHRRRYWNSVMREIERQTGYRHQSETARRYLDP